MIDSTRPFVVVTSEAEAIVEYRDATRESSTADEMRERARLSLQAAEERADAAYQRLRIARAALDAVLLKGIR